MADTIKILTLTDKIPNAVEPGRTIAAKHRAIHMSKRSEVKVVAPVPYFPPLKRLKRWYLFSQIPHREYIDTVEVLHPRYPFLPVIGRPLHGLVYFARILPFLKRLRKRYDFDLIDANWAYPDGYAAVLAGRVLGVPVTIRTLGSDIHVFRNHRLIRPMLMFALRGCKKIIAVCEALKEMMVEMGIPAGKIRVLYNGIDLSLFYPGNREKTGTKLLFVGGLIPIKGVTCLVDAFARVAAVNGALELTMIGKGVLRDSLENQIASLGLKEKVRILGQLSHGEVAEHMRRSDVLLLPSQNEGLPNVVIEALSCHLPVVASRVGGVPEAAAYGKYGVLVEPDNPESLASGIETALNKEWDFGEVGQHLAQFSWETNLSETMVEFASLLEKRTPV